MNALIVYAHPHPESLNAAMFAEVRAGLDSNPEISEIRVLDLYGEGFDPVLKFGKDGRRRDMHLNPDYAVHRRELERADLVVFVYPVWWGRPPAMLLGFFDQIFAAGFAYRHEDGKVVPEGLLKGKRAVCVYTMKGPRFYERIRLRDSHRMLMKRAVLSFVGIRRVAFLGFGGMEKPDGRQREALAKVRRRMERLSA